jgi:hypothetical protein
MADEDIRIEGDIATWEMRKEGDIAGTYVGVFKFRCYLTPLQNIMAGREQRELLGSNMALATEHEAFLAYALTQLRQRIVQAPPFWSSAGVNKSHEGDIADEDILQSILDAAIRAELKYKAERKKRKEEAIERANRFIQAKKEQEKKDSELAKAEEK